MEVWVIVAIYAIAFGMLVWGFTRRTLTPVVLGGILMAAGGGILYTDGYNSFATSCDEQGNCVESTNFVYDANDLVVRSDVNITKYSATNSAFSENFGLGTMFLGVFAGLFGVWQLVKK